MSGYLMLSPKHEDAMAKNPVTDDHLRIKAGLRFLSRADKEVIRACIPLFRLEDLDDSELAHLLRKAEFHVAGKTYQGLMTAEQADYLHHYTGSARQFADAIARVLINMNNRVVDAF